MFSSIEQVFETCPREKSIQSQHELFLNEKRTQVRKMQTQQDAQGYRDDKVLSECFKRAYTFPKVSFFSVTYRGTKRILTSFGDRPYSSSLQLLPPIALSNVIAHLLARFIIFCILRVAHMWTFQQLSAVYQGGSYMFLVQRAYETFLMMCGESKTTLKQFSFHFISFHFKNIFCGGWFRPGE